MATRTLPLAPAFPIRRVVLALLVAVTFALALDRGTGWNPLCPLYEPWSAQWLILGCWYGEPPPQAPGT